MSLPSGYTLLDYILSTGTLYIDTNVTDGNIKISVDISFANVNGNLIWGFNGNAWDGIGVLSGTWWEASSITNPIANIKYNTEYIKNGTSVTRTVNGVSVSGSSSYSTCTGSLTLFASAESQTVSTITYYCSSRIYSSKIYKDNILVRDFIPARRVSDSLIGLYDIVNDVFYTNQGTGSFTGGMLDYLCFEAKTAGSTIGMSLEDISVSSSNFQYTTDRETWNTFTPETTLITLANVGDKVYFKGNNPNGVNQSTSIYHYFVMTGSISASGNIMSLIDNGACSSITIPNNACFSHMFYDCASLITPPVLPATTLTRDCYYRMFYYCTGLLSAPELPATTMLVDCYELMFARCTSLTSPPVLSATSLAEVCYEGMFASCTSLTTAPELPATTLSRYCYMDMFSGCASLTSVPELPATTLLLMCYDYMFENCSSLMVSDTSSVGYERAWKIPSSGTGSGDYTMSSMFSGCPGTRSGGDSPNFNGVQKTYYTQQFKDINVSIKYNSSTIHDHLYRHVTSIPITYQNNVVKNMPGNDLIKLNTKDKICEDFIHVADVVMNTKERMLTDFVEIETSIDDLCFTANTAGSTIAMSVNGTPTLGQNFQTSTDKINWTTFTPGTTTITLANVGDKVYFKGDNPNGVSESTSVDYTFVMTGSISASGNIMSLIDNGLCTTITIPNSYCFYLLFQNCTSLISSPELPATTLADSCYKFMFLGCTSLRIVPELPATTLADSCYSYMFSGCISLTTVAALSATTLADSCYYYMFYHCTSLTTAPLLPATTLADSCYSFMFSGCTFLTTAPALPATTLADSCYSYMFSGCISLTTAPLLPATTLADSCYSFMFGGCASLIAAPELPATLLTNSCYEGMFIDCTSLTIAPKLPATTLAQKCYYEMFSSCEFLTTPPALPATTLPSRCYSRMFEECVGLQVSDTQTTTAPNVWRIPALDTFINSSSQSYMFEGCAGTRSSDHMRGLTGNSCTYYTQNTPI